MTPWWKKKDLNYKNAINCNLLLFFWSNDIFFPALHVISSFSWPYSTNPHLCGLLPRLQILNFTSFIFLCKIDSFSDYCLLSILYTSSKMLIEACTEFVYFYPTFQHVRIVFIYLFSNSQCLQQCSHHRCLRNTF